MRTLTNRAQFLRAARGLKINGRFFALQVAHNDGHPAGIGYTVTKRVGNSPERNRIKRRLREVVRRCEASFADQYDYVLIGRQDALTADFDKLVHALISALDKAGRSLNKSKLTTAATA